MDIPATSDNIPGTVVLRDDSGNISANVTGNLTGTASAIADNSVTSSKIVDGTIVNADINASAAIAGTKIAPNFGSQNVVTTGRNILVTPILYAANQNSAYLIAAPTTYTGASTDWGTFGFQHRIKSNAGGTPRLTIDDSTGEVFTIQTGNVGIGTISPDARVHAQGSSFVALKAKTTSVDSSAGLILENDARDWRILCHDSDKLYFYDNTAATTRMVIDTSGNVGIGTTAPATRLHCDGTIRYTNRPAAGTITAIGFDANGDLRASSSSLRYKHNVEPYAKGLAEVAQLEPVTFNYNGEELVNAGLIVEDLDELGLEEFVLRDSEGTADAIPYGNMVALLINAIKELKVRVEELEAAQ